MDRTMIGVTALALSAAACTIPAHAADAQQKSAGKLPDGRDVAVITLTAHNGVSARILAYGATLQSLFAPDRNGHPADVLLGYDGLASYVDHPNYFGATIGRYANRIADGTFTLDGHSYHLPQNDHGQSLHGGGHGFDKVLWQVAKVQSGPVASVVLRHVSADGDAGYPGTLTATVTYSLDEHGDLGITFDASSDKPTVVNMTNHAFFNMAGEGSADGALNELLTIPASAYTPVDSHLIPTGEMRGVAGTVFDFRKPHPIATGVRDGHDPQIVIGRGYDHNFALDKGATPVPGLAARLTDPVSGRTLDVLTTEPGVQFYTGNFLDGTLVGKQGHVYRMGDGVALEPQKFPDAPNRSAFLSARVDPGKPYHHAMIFRLSVR
ncbi:aldose epimerase family protein [Novosphingobium sp.]|uniref:aldose epimerase family protein n=1 Tax=Novosphingobium sp. TaxID=1874826 RepID=UPI003D118499